jgi:hypothetical protein
MSSTLLEATTNLHSILEPLSSEDRHKALRAVLMLLGENSSSTASKPSEQHAEDGFSEVPSELPTQAKAWIQRHKISFDLISTFIHMDAGNASVIEIPKTNGSARERSQVGYLMAGLASLFSNGEPSFTDEAARSVCTHFGCYDQNNHSTYVKALGNNVMGSKSTGWKLTAPGLAAIANRIKGQQSSD